MRLDLLARAWCALRGHRDIRTFDHGRVAVRCLRCGRESLGVSAVLPPLEPRRPPPVVPHRRRARF